MADKDESGVTDKLKDGEYIEAWRQFKDEHPAGYAVAAVLPVSGQAAAMADYADAMERGDSVDGAIAAASFIPGFKLAKYGSKLAPATLRLKSKMNAAEKALAPITKHAADIGKVADAEQIGETATTEYKKAESDGEDRQREAANYESAWGDLG